MELRAASIIDSEIEGIYACYPFVEQISTREHRHDFYEIFLITEGSVVHRINGDSQLLHSGDLVFIRPNDHHYYQKHADENCELINLAFLSQAFDALADYMGLDRQQALNTASMPLVATLPSSEKNRLSTRLQTWGRGILQNKTHARMTLRAILAQVIADHFMKAQVVDNNDIPVWLADLCRQMQLRQHIIEGRPALMRMANRAPEYVGRSIKTYLGMTPSEYVSKLRIDYASDLLIHTDRGITEVGHDVGFQNLSHFHHRFKAQMDCSPLQYRKMNRRTLIP